MLNRLRALPWGWIVIAIAYIVAALPISPQHRMAWLGLVVAAAYCVLARRTTIQTAEIAQTSERLPIFTVWGTAFRKTIGHRALLLLPTFSLMMASQQFFASSPSFCPALFRAYCMTYSSDFSQIELFLTCVGLLGMFALLDHGLIIALTLMVQRHLPKSSVFVGNTSLGLRFALACTVLSIAAVSVNILEFSLYTSYIPSPASLTAHRVLETLSPAFEPLVSDGVLLGANIVNHPGYCIAYNDDYTGCRTQYDTRPFFARQMVSAFLGILMYGLLILGALRLTAPFSLSLSVAHAPKAKRGLVDQEAEIAYL